MLLMSSKDETLIKSSDMKILFAHREKLCDLFISYLINLPELEQKTAVNRVMKSENILGVLLHKQGSSEMTLFQTMRSFLWKKNEMTPELQKIADTFHYLKNLEYKRCVQV